jgi:hypothetical protein
LSGMESVRPTRILLMPSYGIDVLPLWDHGPGVGGPLDQDDVGISDLLAGRLREWNERWLDHPPEHPPRWSALEENQWRETGYRLAWQLHAELTEVEILILDANNTEVPLTEDW